MLSRQESTWQRARRSSLDANARARAALEAAKAMGLNSQQSSVCPSQVGSRRSSVGPASPVVQTLEKARRASCVGAASSSAASPAAMPCRRGSVVDAAPTMQDRRGSVTGGFQGGSLQRRGSVSFQDALAAMEMDLQQTSTFGAGATSVTDSVSTPSNSVAPASRPANVRRPSLLDEGAAATASMVGAPSSAATPVVRDNTKPSLNTTARVATPATGVRDSKQAAKKKPVRPRQRLLSLVGEGEEEDEALGDTGSSAPGSRSSSFCSRAPTEPAADSPRNAGGLDGNRDGSRGFNLALDVPPSSISLATGQSPRPPSSPSPSFGPKSPRSGGLRLFSRNSTRRTE